MIGVLQEQPLCMRQIKVMRVGYIPYANRSRVHQQDFVQDARGISGALVCSTHGSAMHFTKTMILYETY